MEKGLNGKFRCIEENGDYCGFEVGGIYEFTNGQCVKDDGVESLKYRSLEHFNRDNKRWRKLEEVIEQPSVKIALNDLEINEKFNIRFKNGVLSSFNPYYFDENMILRNRNNNRCISAVSYLVSGRYTIEKIPQDSQEKLDTLKAIKEMEEKLQEMKQNVEKM